METVHIELPSALLKAANLEDRNLSQEAGSHSQCVLTVGSSINAERGACRKRANAIRISRLESGHFFLPGGAEFLTEELAGQTPGRHSRPSRSLLETDGDIPVDGDLKVPVSKFAHHLDRPKLAGVMGGVVLVPVAVARRHA